MAMTGQERCRMHGGSSPQAISTAQRRLTEVAVIQQARAYGSPRYVGPLAAVEEELSRSAGIVAFLDEKLADEVDPGWLMVYQQERRDYRDLAMKMLAANTDERQIRLSELQVDALDRVLRAVLKDCGVNPDSSRARASIARHLRDGGESEIVEAEIVHPSDDFLYTAPEDWSTV